MAARRTHVVLAEQLVKDIDAIVGSRQRSSILTRATEKELLHLRQIEALKATTGEVSCFAPADADT